MSKTNLVIVASILIVLSISCSRFLPGKSTNTSKAPAIDFTTPGKSLDVKVQLDKKQTASGKVSPGGGSVSLTAADGSKFTLDVPAKAVDAETTITLTAVKSLDGAPLDNNSPTAVQLEPSGLFLKEMATLSIVPGKDIPPKQQVAFGYEGEGKDYHLAVVDPKSKDIKIKLMEFSGAGVGSASDSAWAANLQIQAETSRNRLSQKAGEITQRERIRQLLGDESGSDEWAEQIIKLMDQYDEEVILKEMVAAELDCRFARRAIQDILGADRQRQLLGANPDPDIWSKVGKLAEIAAKCVTSYTVSGTSGPVTFSGQICSLDKPFVINGKFANGSETQSFTPGSSTGGSVEEAGNSGGCTQSGGGTYNVTLDEQGSGKLVFTETVTGVCGPYSNTKTVTFKVTLTPASGLTCP